MPSSVRSLRETWKYGTLVPSFDVASCWVTVEPLGVEERRGLLQLLGRALPDRAERERDRRGVVVDRQEVVVRLVGIDRGGAGVAELRQPGQFLALPRPVLVRQHVEPAADVVEFVEDDVVAASAQWPASDLRSVGSKSTSNLRSPFRKASKLAASSAPAG